MEDVSLLVCSGCAEWTLSGQNADQDARRPLKVGLSDKDQTTDGALVALLGQVIHKVWTVNVYTPCGDIRVGFLRLAGAKRNDSSNISMCR